MAAEAAALAGRAALGAAEAALAAAPPQVTYASTFHGADADPQASIPECLTIHVCSPPFPTECTHTELTGQIRSAESSMPWFAVLATNA